MFRSGTTGDRCSFTTDDRRSPTRTEEPPGTGKTHTIRYLARRPDHTTLLITAEQIAALGEYMALARLLSPCVIVIEDVDLIARNREDLDTPQQESLLNRLLNEMDGLRDNSEVLFISTTHRPEALEAALAGRPGRIVTGRSRPEPATLHRSGSGRTSHKCFTSTGTAGGAQKSCEHAPQRQP